MKKMLLLVLVASLTVFSTGCEDDKSSADKAVAAASEADDDDDDDDDDEAEEAEAKGDDDLADLPGECRDYITSFEKCFENMPAGTPEVAKKAMKDAFEQQRSAFASASTDAARSALVPGCKAGLDALKANPQCAL